MEAELVPLLIIDLKNPLLIRIKCKAAIFAALVELVVVELQVNPALTKESYVGLLEFSVVKVTQAILKVVFPEAFVGVAINPKEFA